MFVKALMARAMFFLMRVVTCREVERFAYDFLEGFLDPKTTRQIERHLKKCKNCQHFMLSYKKIRELGPMSRRPSLDPEFKEKIFQFLMMKKSV